MGQGFSLQGETEEERSSREEREAAERAALAEKQRKEREKLANAEERRKRVEEHQKQREEEAKLALAALLRTSKGKWWHKNRGALSIAHVARMKKATEKTKQVAATEKAIEKQAERAVEKRAYEDAASGRGADEAVMAGSAALKRKYDNELLLARKRGNYDKLLAVREQDIRDRQAAARADLQKRATDAKEAAKWQWTWDHWSYEEQVQWWLDHKDREPWLNKPPPGEWSGYRLWKESQERRAWQGTEGEWQAELLRRRLARERMEADKRAKAAEDALVRQYWLGPNGGWQKKNTVNGWSRVGLNEVPNAVQRRWAHENR